MADESPEAPQTCEHCGIAMFPSTRTMRSHGLQAGKAIPRDTVVDVWRCPRCQREAPRR